MFKKFFIAIIFLMLMVGNVYSTTNPFQYPLFQVIDGDGNPVSGGLVYTYAPGTTTPKVAYRDKDFTVAASNPIVLDSKGEYLFYLAGEYKIDVKTSAGVQVDGFPIDNVVSIDFQTTVDTVAALRALTWIPTDGQVVSLAGYHAKGDNPIRQYYWSPGSVATDNGGTIIDQTSIVGNGRWIAVIPSYNVDVFGAVGDGATDDKDSMVAAITAAGAGGFVEWTADKIYACSAQLTPLSQQTWDFNNSTLFSLPTQSLSSSSIWCQDVNGVSILNLVGDGNRLNRTGTNGGAFIWVGDCNDIFISNAEIADPANDGVTIGYDDPTDADSRSFNPTITNLKVYRAYRNGFSVVGVVNANFSNILCNDTIGTNPQAGIDVESDETFLGSGVWVVQNENVKFLNTVTTGNAGNGFQTVVSADSGIFVNNIEASDNGGVGVLASNITTKIFNVSGAGNGTSLTSVWGLDLATLIDDHRTIQMTRDSLTGGAGADVIGAGVFTDGTFTTATITTKWPSSAIIGKLVCTAQVIEAVGASATGEIRVVYGVGPTQVGFTQTVKASIGGATSIDAVMPVALQFYDVVGARGTTRTYTVQGKATTGDSLTLSNYDLILYEVAAF